MKANYTNYFQHSIESTALTVNMYTLQTYFLLLVDAMATEEWKKEVQKHEQYIKDLEEKFKAKCEAMKVAELLSLPILKFN